MITCHGDQSYKNDVNNNCHQRKYTPFGDNFKYTILFDAYEALIKKTYNADEIQQRILNGDGGSWIKETYDLDAIFQLDGYHIYQEILRKIADKKVQKDIRELFEEEKIEEMLEYIEMYATGTESYKCQY